MSEKHYVHPPDETELAKVLRESRGWLDAYGTTLIYSVAAVLAATAIIVYLQRIPPATAPASQALLLATTPEEYRDVADQFENTEIGIRARLRQADLLLNNGVGNMFTDRATAATELEAAKKAYERLAERKDLSSDVRQRVLVGLARIQETQCDGTPAKTDAAIAAWKSLLDQFPDSKVFKPIAEERIKQLPLESTKEFYAWFQQQKPKRQDDLVLPQDGPPTVPDIPGAGAFTLPDLSLPGTSEQPSASKTGEPAAPAAAAPADAKPAEATPADAKPAEPAPAEPKPADVKPAEPAPAEPRPADAKPAEPAPAEPKPADAKPAEPAPAEPKPADVKPAEPAPAEPKPVEPAAPDATPEPPGKSDK